MKVSYIEYPDDELCAKCAHGRKIVVDEAEGESPAHICIANTEPHTMRCKKICTNHMIVDPFESLKNHEDDN